MTLWFREWALKTQLLHHLGWVFSDYFVPSAKHTELLDRIRGGNSNFKFYLLVSNNKLIWNEFLSSYDPSTSRDPFDEFITKSLSKMLNRWLDDQSISQCKLSVFYSHKVYENHFIPFQQIADDCSHAKFHKNSYLSIHEQFGPWIGLRGLVEFDLGIGCKVPIGVHIQKGKEKPIRSLDEVLKGLDEDLIAKKLQKALESGDQWDPVERSNDWVKLRDSISSSNPNWTKWRYSQDQLEYHYTKNRKILDEFYSRKKYL